MPSHPTGGGGVLVTEALPEMMRQRRRAKTGQITPFRDWAERVPEAKAGIMDWKRFPFQPELYDQHGAMDPDLCIKKATQLGISAWALRWLLYHVDMRARTGLYVFPTRKAMYDFADARVKSVITASPYLTRRIPARSVANKGLRQVGIGWAYFRGSESKNDLDSIDADNLVLDEYDTLRQENIPDAERRITGSVNGMIRRVGVPSNPGKGIDALYARSDQRRWVVKCESCGTHQPISYDKNVHEGDSPDDGETYPDAQVVCHPCRADEDRLRPLPLADGEWVATFPDRPRRGYHIPRLIVPNGNLSDIVVAHQLTAPHQIKTHMNKDLGLAYVEEEGQLSLEAIERATRDELPAEADTYNPDLVRTCGIDVASTRALNVRVSQWIGETTCMPLFVGEAQDFNDVIRILERYQPHMTTIDHEPDYRLASAVRDRYPGRVWLARYSGSLKGVWSPDDAMREVTVNRTIAIDATFDSIRAQRRLLPGKYPKDYRDQLQALARTKEEDEYGNIRVRYEKNGPRDDYAHSEVFDFLARQVLTYTREAEAAIEGETVPFGEMYNWEASRLDAGTVDRAPDIEEYEGGFDPDRDTYQPGFG